MAKLRYQLEALKTYRERATNTWVMVRWLGVSVIVAGLGAAGWSLNNGEEFAAKAAAVALALGGLGLVIFATIRRRRELARLYAGDAK